MRAGRDAAPYGNAGKAADFTILEDDPLNVDPMAIRDIGVWGTVLRGRPCKAAG